MEPSPGCRLSAADCLYKGLKSEGVCLILFIGEECSQGSPLRGQPCALARTLS